MRTTTINIMDQDIVFNADTCSCYDDILNIITEQATTETIKKMNAMPETDFINLLANIWLELEQTFEMNTELTQSLKSIDWKAEIAKRTK